MRTFAAGILLLGAGCMEPSKGGQMELAVRGLADLHTWDPVMEARGQYSYDIVANFGPDIWSHLAAHLTDETPTAIYDRIVDIRPTVSDVCVLMLMKMMNLDKKELYQDGLFISTLLPNPVFCLRWDPGARQRVQTRIFKMLPPPE